MESANLDRNNITDANELIDNVASSDSDHSLDSQCLMEKDTNNEKRNIINFEKIYESIDEEERLLNKLEERRKKLEVDMQRLEKEIEKEKLQFRQAIDNEITKKKEILNTEEEISETGVSHISKIDFLKIGDFQSKFQEYRDVIQESAEQSPNTYEDDEELERLKSNLVSYRKTLDDTKKDKIIKQKKKVASEIFQKHLDKVGIKCDEQINKLATIQKSIEKIGEEDTDDTGSPA